VKLLTAMATNSPACGGVLQVHVVEVPAPPVPETHVFVVGAAARAARAV